MKSGEFRVRKVGFNFTALIEDLSRYDDLMKDAFHKDHDRIIRAEERIKDGFFEVFQKKQSGNDQECRDISLGQMPIGDIKLKFG